jgi:esterase/lipase
MKRILYLHGLESKANCDKVGFLRSLGHIVTSPKINYREDNCYDNLKTLVKYNTYDVIIGSSMGGWVAWNLGKDIGVPVLLLNPAMHSRSIDIDIEPVRDQKASKVFLAVGLADDVIDPEITIDWLNKHDKLDWNLNNTYKAIYGHRTSVERFIDIWVHFEKDIEFANEIQEIYAV